MSLAALLHFYSIARDVHFQWELQQHPWEPCLGQDTAPASSTHSVITCFICCFQTIHKTPRSPPPLCRKVGMAEWLALPAPAVRWRRLLLLSVWPGARLHLGCGEAFPRGSGWAPEPAPLARGRQGKHHVGENGWGGLLGSVCINNWILPEDKVAV